MGRRGNRGRSSVALLRHVHLAVPPAPRLGRGEHTATAAHVTEGAGRANVGTGPADARNTRHSAASAPRSGSVAVTGLVLVGVSLAMVLVHVGVDVANKIWAQRGREDRRQLHVRLARGVRAVELIHRHSRARSGHATKRTK